MMDQIKEALAKVNYHGWSTYPKQDVTYKWLQYLLEELEKAQDRFNGIPLIKELHDDNMALRKENERLRKIADAKFISWNKGDEEERWSLQERNIELETEHAAMKEALERISETTMSMFLSLEDMLRYIKEISSSTLSQPKTDEA